MALAYPCQLDASLMGMIIDGHARRSGDEKLRGAMRVLIERCQREPVSIA